MEEIHVKAYGKVNIGLDITGVRADGYHLLKTVMQTVDVADDIIVRKTGQGITLKTDLEFLPTDEKNLAFRAAQLVFAQHAVSEGVQIEIAKHIPVGGGMAGGSTDGAGVLLALDTLFDLHMGRRKMDALAVQLGADVPFCLRRGTYLAEGIGERLTKLPSLPNWPVVICAPGFPVSTPWAYKAFDEAEHPFHPDMDALLAAIEAQEAETMFRVMGNSLELVVEAEHPLIAELKKTLLQEGALQAMMSGSGSTVFGVFQDAEQAADACARIKAETACKEVFLTTFVSEDGIDLE